MDNAILKWFSLQRSQNIPIDDTIIKEKVPFFPEILIFQSSKLLMVGWISGKKGKEPLYTATVNIFFL